MKLYDITQTTNLSNQTTTKATGFTSKHFVLVNVKNHGVSPVEPGFVRPATINLAAGTSVDYLREETHTGIYHTILYTDHKNNRFSKTLKGA